MMRGRDWMWVMMVAAAVTFGTGTALAADDVYRESMLQVDDRYDDSVGSRTPGQLSGTAAPTDPTSVDGPRARVGLTSVLVYMDTATKSRSSERANVRAFATQQDGIVKYEYGAAMPGVINLRDIPVDQVEELRKLPGVLRVEKDEYHPNVLRLHDSIPLIRGLQSQITGAGYSADGAGVRICIVDTGIDSDHVMYSDRIDTSAGYDFYNDDSNPEDDNGHGSHCAGIAAGGTGLSWDPCGTGSMPLQGVAPGATLIGVKVLNSSGGGYDSDIIAGIDYCADQTSSGAQADVISMSIGTEVTVAEVAPTVGRWQPTTRRQRRGGGRGLRQRKQQQRDGLAGVWCGRHLRRNDLEERLSDLRGQHNQLELGNLHGLCSRDGRGRLLQQRE